MDEYADYAGRLLADRYRLPQPPSDAYELAETVAYDTASGQEVLVRQVPLPEVVDAEFVSDGEPEEAGPTTPGGGLGRATRRPADPAARRAVEAALAASHIPDHPRLDQVFDVFVEGDGLWIVSELVPGRPLAALLAESPLGPHRAAEIGADLLAALGTVHAHGWTHRNITARTVLVCDDGRAVLTGLAAGAAEETLCGYDPLPVPEGGVGPATEPRNGTDTAGRWAEGPGDAEAGPLPPARHGAGPSGEGSEAPPADRYGYGYGYGEDGRGPESDPWQQSPGGPAGVFGDRGGAPANGHGPLASGRGPSSASELGPLPAGFVRESHADGLHRPGPGGGGPPPYGGGTGGNRAWPQGFEGDLGDPVTAPPASRTGQPSPSYEEGGAAGRDAVPPTFGAAPPPGTDAQREGIFGFEGAESGGGAAARAARRGAIAAYRAGAQAASARMEAEARGGRATPYYQESAQESVQGTSQVPPQGSPPEPSRGPSQEPPYGTSYEPAYEPSYESSSPRFPHRPSRALPHEVPRAAAAGRTAQDWWADNAVPGESGIEQSPGGQRSVPAGEGPTALPAPRPAGSRAVPVNWTKSAGPAPTEPAGQAQPEAAAPERRYRGPVTALAAERARQARMTVVGPVTERWAPEQAGPVYENWRLAPPVGPAADLWALGVLLFRIVQGHAPYPEDSVAELVQMVCAEPPAFAEECGPLRPVVESLMRQDPTERPEFEELRGWLRSLVRSAPEPEVGRHTLTAPPSLEPGRPSDPRRLPIKRRRGELVRRRRFRRQPVAPRPSKHRRADREPRPEPLEPPGQSPQSHQSHQPPHPKPPKQPKRQKPPREARQPRRSGPLSLGRMLVGLVLLLLTLMVLYAMWFMPEQGDGTGDERNQKGSAAQPSEEAAGREGAEQEEDGTGGEREKEPQPDTEQPQNSRPAEPVEGFALHDDPTGFRIAVPEGWDRRGPNSRGQVRFDQGDFELVVVKGRDTTAEYGKDPMVYQSDEERELEPYRTSDWATATGLRRIDVGDAAMAEGTYTWKDSSGREVYVRNRALILDGRYHLVLVIGPAGETEEVDRYFEGAVDTYRVLAE